MTPTAVTQQAIHQASGKTAVRPFHVNVPEADLAELPRRINATKWPDEKRLQMHPREYSSRRPRRSRAIGRQSMTGARSKQK